MEAITKFNFTATAEDELSFPRGAILKILNMEDDSNWFLAELNGNEGIIPANYIQMKPYMNWYHGRIERGDAITMLKDKPAGSFIVRRSESSPGQFSISVSSANSGTSIQHFKVLRTTDNTKYYLYDTHKFNSLNELVEFYKTANISKNSSSPELKLKEMKMEDLFVQAVFDFEPQENTELRFRKGDLITVVNRTIDENWWIGIAAGKKGEFPVNYVAPYGQTTKTTTTQAQVPTETLPGTSATPTSTIVPSPQETSC